MAQHTTIRLVDDIDGTDAAETVEFAIDGKQLEIDLSSSNAQRMRELLAEFIAASRRRSNGVRPRSSVGASRRMAEAVAKDREQNQAIRRWAWDNGYPELGKLGRIPEHIQEDYHKHEGRPKPPQTPKFVDPDPPLESKTWDELDEEERSEVMVWVASLGLKWPTRSPKKKNALIEAFADHDEKRAKGICED